MAKIAKIAKLSLTKVFPIKVNLNLNEKKKKKRKAKTKILFHRYYLTEPE